MQFLNINVRHKILKSTWLLNENKDKTKLSLLFIIFINFNGQYMAIAMFIRARDSTMKHSLRSFTLGL